MARHHHAHGRGPHGTAGDTTAHDQRRLLVALALIVGFMAAEIVVGLLAHSLALLSDAGHMLTDAAALGLSVVALRLAARPSRGGFTFGLKRAEILSGLGNGVTLFVVAALVVVEAARRLADPPVVDALPVLGVALAGIAVNVAATWQIARAQRRSLNIEGSLQHMVTDLYAVGGTAVAASVVLLTGFQRADPIASLFTAALMLRAGYGVIRAAGLVLLEAAPTGTDPDAVGNALARHPHVANVHDLHVWEVTSGFPALSAHVLVHPNDDCHAIRIELETLLRARFGITHTTLQVDHDSKGRLVRVGMLRRSAAGSSGGTAEPQDAPPD